MLEVELIRNTNLDRDFIFKLSTDIENFSKLLPKYFKSLTILESKNSEFLVEEKITFMGRSIVVKTKHVVRKPNFHSIQILNGLLKNSYFSELYEPSVSGTRITIDVKLKFNGISKLLFLFSFLIKNQINKVMDEFLFKKFPPLALEQLNANSINTILNKN
jgi:ribosome-associated toxin RatA of RatAB toxin-antitoxin module